MYTGIWQSTDLDHCMISSKPRINHELTNMSNICFLKFLYLLYPRDSALLCKPNWLTYLTGVACATLLIYLTYPYPAIPSLIISDVFPPLSYRTCLQLVAFSCTNFRFVTSFQFSVTSVQSQILSLNTLCNMRSDVIS